MQRQLKSEKMFKQRKPQFSLAILFFNFIDLKKAFETKRSSKVFFKTFLTLVVSSTYLTNPVCLTSFLKKIGFRFLRLKNQDYINITTGDSSKCRNFPSTLEESPHFARFSTPRFLPILFATMKNTCVMHCVSSSMSWL